MRSADTVDLSSVAFLTGADSILLAWTVAAALSLTLAAATFGSRAGRSLSPDFTDLGRSLREMASSLVGQHLITVTAMLAGYLLPVIVYARLSATDNAYFYITWMLGSVFFIVSPAVSAALFVEGAAVGNDMRLLVRKCVLIISALLAIPVIVYLLGGRLILSLFGPDYVAAGYLLLLLLTLSAVPDAITNVAVAVLRVSGRMGVALLLNGGMLVLCIVATWFLLPITGIAGAGVCWLVSQLIGAVGVLLFWRKLVDHGQPVIADEQMAADVLPVAVRSATRVKVLQVSDGYRPATGGLERVVEILSKKLVSLGHPTTVATLSRPDAAATEEHDGVVVRRLDGYTRHLRRLSSDPGHYFHPTCPDPQLVRRLGELVAEFRPDVVHAHGWILNSVLSLRLPPSTALVATLHDYGLTCANKTLIRRAQLDQICPGQRLSRCLDCATQNYGPVKGPALAIGLQHSLHRLDRVTMFMPISAAVRDAASPA